MKERKFMTKDGNYHTIDTTGNHFINGKCVNPLKDSGEPIGVTYPHKDEIVSE